MARPKKERPEPMPCPCGRLADVTKIKPRHWMVACADLCGCGHNLVGFGDCEDDAIEAWNEEVKKK